MKLDDASAHSGQQIPDLLDQMVRVMWVQSELKKRADKHRKLANAAAAGSSPASTKGAASGSRGRGTKRGVTATPAATTKKRTGPGGSSIVSEVAIDVAVAPAAALLATADAASATGGEGSGEGGVEGGEGGEDGEDDDDEDGGAEITQEVIAAQADSVKPTPPTWLPKEWLACILLGPPASAAEQDIGWMATASSGPRAGKVPAASGTPPPAPRDYARASQRSEAEASRLTASPSPVAARSKASPLAPTQMERVADTGAALQKELEKLRQSVDASREDRRAHRHTATLLELARLQPENTVVQAALK